MKVRVLYFGILRDLFAASGRQVELPPGATVGDLLAAQSALLPQRPAALWSTLAVSVNQEYAQTGQILREGDEVALLPPVSGGAPSVRVELTREPIRTAELLEQIRAGEDGAVLVFEGIVRNNTRGRRTLRLDYEAYEAMAIRQMEQLASESLARFGIRAVTIVHRLGVIEISEASILILTASAHRSAAYEASRWLIDTIKKTVPIWKKEHFKDGAVWVDGEPFPPEILPGSMKEQPE